MIQREAWFSHTASIEQEILALGNQLIRTYEEDGKVDWEIVHRLRALEGRSGKPVLFQFELNFGKVKEASGHAYVELLAKNLQGQTQQRTFGLNDLAYGERPLYERVQIGGFGVSTSWGKDYMQVPVTSSLVLIPSAVGSFRLSHTLDWDDELDTPAAVDDLREMMRNLPGAHTVRNIRVFRSENPDNVGDTVQGDVDWHTRLELPLQEAWISDVEAAK